jgi:hypothetical protein
MAALVSAEARLNADASRTRPDGPLPGEAVGSWEGAATGDEADRPGCFKVSSFVRGREVPGIRSVRDLGRVAGPVPWGRRVPCLT